MRWTLRQLAEATGGTIEGAPAVGSPDLPAFGPVTIDSRQVAAGGVFVPIVAARDGHAFIRSAVGSGAGAYLYEPSRRPGEGPTAAVGIAVADTGRALLDIGRAGRDRLDATVVGITGSVGKTSTKDLTAAAAGAGRRVSASPLSFNNELGVPLTLANAAETTEVSVLEMGARGPGHIAALCAVARPGVAVVTAVAAAHLGMFGDLDAVARAKAELVEALPPGGLAVLNGDDPRVSGMARSTPADVLHYGVLGRGAAGHAGLGGRTGGRLGQPSAGLDVVAESVVLDEQLRPRYRLRGPWGSAEVRLAVRGAHQVGNSLAALTVACRCGVPLDDAVGALVDAVASPWRMELGVTSGGARILNDAYNANPASMAAALAALAELPAERRVAVLGVMAELGPDAPAEHRQVAELAAAHGIEVVAIGTHDYGVAPVADVEDAFRAVRAAAPLDAGTAVLVKASRVAGLERLAERLLRC